MSKIVVFVNGQARQIDPGTSLTTLIGELKLTPRMVLVEHNGRALLRAEWPDVSLDHGDRLEVLRVVAGG
jgi:thiamine biosynthesis protein ThiS